MIEMRIPSPGESVTEVMIDTWHKQDGDIVQKDEALADIQSDKAMLTLYAEAAGKLSIKVKAGETVKVGEVACSIDETQASAAPNNGAAAPAAQVPTPAAAPASAAASQSVATSSYLAGVPSPAAAKAMVEQSIPAGAIQGTGPGGRVTKTDVIEQGATAKAAPAPAAPPAPAAAKPSTSSANSSLPPAFTGERQVYTQKMSQLRKTVAARLVSAKNDTAMLTTFNEVDMTNILDVRKKYKEQFQKVHEVGLGFMGFFTKACTEALREFPLVGGQIHDEGVHTFNYVDMGIAVSSDRGLVVPVVRNAHAMSLAEIEREVARLAGKARDNKITLEDMQGGTFTITNGGVFGSLLSTPILNPPQSAILGMHKTQERPVALNGQVVIRPMMYVALSYDHRIIDGKEAVSFLVRVKEYLEDPTRMLLHA